MTIRTSRYYAAELEERLIVLAELDEPEAVSRSLVLQIVVVTLLLPVVALLIGWVAL